MTKACAFKRIIGIGIVAILLAASFAGCGNEYNHSMSSELDVSNTNTVSLHSESALRTFDGDMTKLAFDNVLEAATFIQGIDNREDLYDINNSRYLFVFVNLKVQRWAPKKCSSSQHHVQR